MNLQDIQIHALPYQYVKFDFCHNLGKMIRKMFQIFDFALSAAVIDKKVNRALKISLPMKDFESKEILSFYK